MAIATCEVERSQTVQPRRSSAEREGRRGRAELLDRIRRRVAHPFEPPPRLEVEAAARRDVEYPELVAGRGQEPPVAAERNAANPLRVLDLTLDLTEPLVLWLAVDNAEHAVAAASRQELASGVVVDAAEEPSVGSSIEHPIERSNEPAHYVAVRNLRYLARDGIDDPKVAVLLFTNKWKIAHAVICSCHKGTSERLAKVFK